MLNLSGNITVNNVTGNVTGNKMTAKYVAYNKVTDYVTANVTGNDVTQGVPGNVTVNNVRTSNHIEWLMCGDVWGWGGMGRDGEGNHLVHNQVLISLCELWM